MQGLLKSVMINGLLAVAMWLPLGVQAQIVPGNDPLPVETQLTMHLRDLEQSWEVMQSRAVQPQGAAPSGSNIRLPDDETFGKQLTGIQGSFKFALYPRVRELTRFFLDRSPEALEAVLGMALHYQPVIDRSLTQYRLPQNLHYLPIALSAMNVCAVSEHGTAGLWQLNFHVAIRYGLHCSEIVDERRDLHRSTHAAAAYLSDLHKQQGDWMLALTAFVNGPAALNRAKQRSGGNTDFASLYPHLPTAARDYVPAFIAACYVAQFAKELGVQGLPVQRYTNPDRIQLQQPLAFKAVSKVLRIPEEQLRGLNPVCRMAYIPGLNVPVQLCLPAGYGAKFTELRDSIYTVQAALDKAKEAEKTVVQQPEAEEAAGSEDDDPAEGGATKPGDEDKPNTFTPPPGTVPVRYTILPGDNLGKIAQDHGVTVSHLMAANQLKNNNIRAGDTLVIHVAKGKAPVKLGPAPKLPSPEGRPVKSTVSPTNAGFVWYTVKSGDNLWSISRKYPGVTEKDIMQLNGIGEKLQPGMKLKIPTKKP